MVWAIIGGLTLAAIAALIWPWLRRPPAPAARAEYDLSVYRDQLGEIDGDLRRGLLTEDEAASARLAVQRRVLTADAEERRVLAGGNARKRLALAVAIAVVVPLAAVALYASRGAPGLPGQPFAERRAADLETAMPDASLADVEVMVARLAERLRATPDDAEGWRVLGWAYVHMERYQEAADAYARAIDLRGDVAAYRSAYGEALVLAAGGMVTPAAAEAFGATLARDPTDARARYFLGAGKLQSGDRRGALDDWLRLVRDTPPEAPWLEGLRAQVANLARDLGVDVGAALAPPPAAEGERGDGMTPAERDAMIRGMVERLAQRLEQAPRDPEGWVRLARARQVLGEPEAARAALERAVQVYADSPEVQQQIRTAARDLGIDLGGN